MGCVYLATSPSGKQYVGITTQQFERRIYCHRYDAEKAKSDLIFHRAIRRYGFNKIHWEILHDGIEDQDELFRLEITEIERHETLAPKGYNATTGGGSGWRLAEETKQVLSLRARDQWKDENRAQQTIAALKQTWQEQPERFENCWSPETRAKRAASMKVLHATPEYKKKLSEAVSRSHAEATCEERAARGKAISKVLTGRKGDKWKPHMFEVIPKAISDAWADPEKKKAWGGAISKTRRERSREVVCAGVKFTSVYDAATSLNLNPQTIYGRIDSAHFSNWHYDENSQCTWKPPHQKPFFADGLVFKCYRDAAFHYCVTTTTVANRKNNDRERWRFWHTIPNHNDPECDAVEECWALLQFAEANPDHDNAPSWALDALGIARHGAVPANLWAAE